MNLTRGLLAAVGAFWSELIPPYVPADYEDQTECMDPDFEVPGSPLCHFCDLPSGHDGPHKDCMCGKCPTQDFAGAAASLADGNPLGACCVVKPSVREDKQPDVTRPADPRPTVPTGVESPQAPPVGLPIFKASELVTVAAEYILNHYRRNGVRLDGEAWLAAGAAEVVVSALVYELQSLAYDQNQTPQQ